MAKVIVWLVKFFSEEEHADEFRRGLLLLRRLSHFKKIEDPNDAARRDPNEAVHAWLQPPGLHINFLSPGMSALSIGPDDLAGPVSISLDDDDHAHVYCMYALHLTGSDEPDDGATELSLEQAAELERQLQIDPRCLEEFGRFAVVVRAADFIERLVAKLKERRQWACLGLVEYYDDAVFNGQFAADTAAFRKQMRFAHQQEYRVCIRTGTVGDDPLMLDIGDITDMSAKVEAAKLNSMFQVKAGPIPR